MKELRLSGRLIGAASFCALSMAVLYGALSLTAEPEWDALSGTEKIFLCPWDKVSIESIKNDYPARSPGSYLPPGGEPAAQAVVSDRALPDRGERYTISLSGIASWYGGSDGFDGATTASGEIFDASAYTAAHPTLPFGTRVRVTYRKTGRSVVVRINDRGPFVHGRIIDLSRAAAIEIGLKPHGVGLVVLELLD